MDDIYHKIYASIQRCDASIDFVNVDPQKIVEVYNQVILDRPELFWAGVGCSCSRRNIGFHQHISFMPIISDSVSVIKRKKQEMNRVVSEILCAVDHNWSAYEKALYLHDYLIGHTTYDKTASEQIPAFLQKKRLPDSFNAYGCLVQHQAVCAGYSRAYQLLLREVGIQSGRVTGQKKSGEKHEWNYIKLDDGYHYVDVTWDEPEIDGRTGDVCTHEFFCITSSELAQSHILNPNQFIPVCNSSKYDYYQYFGYYYSRYDFQKISSLFSCIPHEESVEIKFGNNEALTEAVDDLFGRNKFFQIQRAEPFTNAQYFIGASGRVLRIVGS